MARPDTPKRRTSRSFRTDRRAWMRLMTAGAVGGAAGWFLPSLPQRRPVPPVMRNHDPRFVVLGYGLVSDKQQTEHMTEERLQTQFLALQHAGFTPVRVADIEAFYFQGAPLPDKPLLLTFDDGYLETYRVVDPLLADLGWPAVMAITTGRLVERDTHFLYWDRLRRMLASGRWELATQGHRGHLGVPTPDRQRAPFVAVRSWIEDEGREETLDEYGRRLAADLDRASGLIRDHLNYRVTAHIPVYGNPAAVIRDVSLFRRYEATVGERFRLAFLDDPFGVNDRNTSPLRLGRLSVEPRWPTSELLDRVNFAMSESISGRTADGKKLDRGRWRAAEGDVTVLNDGIRIAGLPQATALLSGSQWLDNWQLDATLDAGPGQVWLTQQAQDPHAEWRLGGNAKGLYVQVRHWGQPIRTLARFPHSLTPGQRRLRVIRRGPGLWVELNGQAVSERPILLPGEWHGAVGWTVWNGAGPAQLLVRDFSLESFPYRLASLPERPDRQAVQAVIRDARRISALSIPWIEVTDGEQRPLAQPQQLVAILTHRYGWAFVPRIRVVNGGEGSLALTSTAADGAQGRGQPWTDTISDLVRRSDWAGVEVVLSGQPTAAATRAAADLSRTLKRSRKRLWLRWEQEPARPELHASNRHSIG